MDVVPSATRNLGKRVQRWYGQTEQMKGENKIKMMIRENS
jgi:hypothetical protein